MMPNKFLVKLELWESLVYKKSSRERLLFGTQLKAAYK